MRIYLQGVVLLGAMLMATLMGCTAIRSFLALDGKQETTKPIRNPFGEFSTANGPNEAMIFRTKKGDNTVEVEMPKATQEKTDFIIPVAPVFRESKGSGHYPTSDFSTSPGRGLDEKYNEQVPGLSDREIARSFPQGMAEDSAKRREVEQELGLMPPEEPTPQRSKSYLAITDRVKQLYKLGRHEAALLEIDELVKEFPTDPKLHQMRGTLLDRLGHADLALKSWNQALRLDPSNVSLQKFIERKQQKRSIASP